MITTFLQNEMTWLMPSLFMQHPLANKTRKIQHSNSLKTTQDVKIQHRICRKIDHFDVLESEYPRIEAILSLSK
ncbi:hypothetical protein B4585_08075 [Lacticaseibacillus paracasei]|nr:hypothetical protein [Lacticaseibacillus paracasei]OPH06581.1 hypothetical protein B4585_08075 [Lacticaseibacillus paracasei]